MPQPHFTSTTKRLLFLPLLLPTPDTNTQTPLYTFRRSRKKRIAHSNATMSLPPTTNTGYPALHQQHQYHASASDSILDPIPASHSTQTPTAPAPSPASVTPHAGSPSHPRHQRGPPPPFDPRSAHTKKDEDLRRNLQARGKNYNLISSSSSSSNSAGKSVGAQASRAWGYEERQRRDEAAGILESEEMIMWIAGVRNEVRCSFSFFPFSSTSRED